MNSTHHSDECKYPLPAQPKLAVQANKISVENKNKTGFLAGTRIHTKNDFDDQRQRIILDHEVPCISNPRLGKLFSAQVLSHYDLSH